MKAAIPFRSLSDQELTDETKRLAVRERSATADFIACLEEFDRRRIYLGLGYGSLYSYCIYGLGLGEGATARRVAVARAVGRFPVILNQLRDGALPLGSLALLAPVLTEQNHMRLLGAAVGKKRDDVLILVASVKPKTEVRTSIRKSPTPLPAVETTLPAAATLWSARAQSSQQTAAPTVSPDGSEASGAASPSITANAGHQVVVRPLPPAVVLPLTPERYKIQITVSKQAHDNLRELQRLMRHTYPNGDAALIIERAIAYLLDRVQQRKLGMLKKDRAAAKFELQAG